jgi:RNA ligase
MTLDAGVVALQQAVRERGLHADYRDLGNIRTARYENLLLFNYTALAQYAATWTPVERAARGLILDGETGEIVALPWSKFFNLGETEETRLENLPRDGFEVTDKLDGSLGILYKRMDGYAIATRGSFDGEQAQWATAFLRRTYPDLRVPDRLTLLFEIIYPENRVVLDYGNRAELVLIGARNAGDGYDYTYPELQVMAAQHGFPLVPAATVHTLDDLVSDQCVLTGIEGWVVRFANGLRVKIKCDEYLRLHRIIFGLTPERIREALLADWSAFVVNIPEELRPGIEAAMIDALERQEAHIRRVFDTVCSTVGTARKDFALHVVKHYPAERPYLFMLLDNRPIRDVLLRNLDLTTLAETAET